jgi:hypothetical protein
MRMAQDEKSVNDPVWIDGLIQKGWPDLARFAYERFLYHGRGAVVIDLSDLVDVPVENNEAQVDFDARYIPLSRNILKVPAMIKSIQEYDPEHQVVFIFALRQDTEFKDARSLVEGPSDRLSPKESYEAKKA